MNRIPKIIHYCWFGGKPLPALARKCIASWRKYLPEYEIKEWNESNFDVNIIPYTAEAYQAKKYAFVSDYARFWILYRYGGLYFDTDVEVLSPMQEIIDRGPFMGCECEAKEGATPDEMGVAPGLGLGVNPGLGLYKEFLDLYAPLHFLNADKTYNLTTVVEYTTGVLVKHGLQNTDQIQFIAGVYIYPKDYLCPKDYIGRITITENTYAIHHFASSWNTGLKKAKKKLFKIMGYRLTALCISLKAVLVGKKFK